MSDKNKHSAVRLNAKGIADFGVQYAIYLVFLLLVIVITIKEPAFLSIENFRNILSMSATRIIIALGVGGILISNGTDLSAGRQVGFAAVLSGSLLQALDYPRRMYPELPELPLIVPILVAMAVCGFIGLINGLIVAKLKVPPFIATLGTMVAVYGANSLYFDRPPYGAQPIGGLDKRFTTLGSGYVGPNGVYSIPYIVIIASFVTIVDLIMAAYVPALHAKLGLFIPLIVVNCIILGRAEAFAAKNTLVPSMIDGLGMGARLTRGVPAPVRISAILP